MVIKHADSAHSRGVLGVIDSKPTTTNLEDTIYDNPSRSMVVLSWSIWVCSRATGTKEVDARKWSGLRRSHRLVGLALLPYSETA